MGARYDTGLRRRCPAQAAVCKGGVDRNNDTVIPRITKEVAVRKDGVDQNTTLLEMINASKASLPAEAVRLKPKKRNRPGRDGSVKTGQTVNFWLRGRTRSPNKLRPARFRRSEGNAACARLWPAGAGARALKRQVCADR